MSLEKYTSMIANGLLDVIKTIMYKGSELVIIDEFKLCENSIKEWVEGVGIYNNRLVTLRWDIKGFTNEGYPIYNVDNDLYFVGFNGRKI